jgi:uncharacterized protein
MTKEEKEAAEKLKEQMSFPSEYIFKFIVPNEPEKVNHIYALFDQQTAIITHRLSKTERFFSFTIKELMLDAESIIEKYKLAKSVEGIISL